MPYITLAPPAGLFRNGTIYQSKGRWYAANLIRFQQDNIKPIGGWQIRSATAAPFVGACRSVLSWRDNSNNRWIGVGTHSKLYVQDEVGANHDITPIRRTVTLGGNPITTINGSGTVTIADTAHGAGAGDFVIISGATAFNGLTTGQLNQTFTILTVPNANSYTIATGGTANAGSAGGGAAVVANYQITAGRADASQNLGYGGGAYGSRYYGVPPSNTGAYLPATVWSMEAWGERMVACSDSDGKLYEWALVTATPAAAISGAPTGCAGLVVTQDGFLMGLAAGSNGRKVQWCDQQNNTVWTPSATNQAGDYTLPTAGTLQCGKAVRGGALLFTDVDAWRAFYIGTPLVYGFEKVGSGCGPISKGAVAAHDSVAAWMSPGPSFCFFDGQVVQPLDCDVLDYLSGMNPNQVSKVTVVHLAKMGEVWWFYPSTDSTECDRAVVWAYRESERLGKNIWTTHMLARTAGTGKGVSPNPLMTDAAGILYEHETGLNFDGAEPYLETGPFELGQGDYMAEIQGIVPDELANGDVNATLYCRIYPNSAETTYGPYSLASPTDVLVQGRETRIRYAGVAATDWRIGNMRLDVIKGDRV